MTEAGWTRNKPTVAGWYWWRQEKGMMEVPREVVYSPFYRGLVTQGERLIAGDGEWLGPITPDSFQQGRVAANVDALVDRFLAWPLPASVCSDLCATKQGYPHRSGTNLLSAAEARAMLEYVLGIESLAQQAQEGGVGGGKEI